MQIATLLLVYYIAAICIWPISSKSELAIKLNYYVKALQRPALKVYSNMHIMLCAAALKDYLA